ncbi:MAG: hypothetical protein U0J86_02020 [Collinsella sp.]|nr:hypothetical protein [Collinsella sp.]
MPRRRGARNGSRPLALGRPARRPHPRRRRRELWCDLTVNLPEQALPGDDWAFVPAENLEYLRALERQGLAEMGGAARYGSFGQLAVMAHLAPALIARG